MSEIFIFSNTCFFLYLASADEHQSEYVSDYDKRRAWLTEFTGSAGVAIVTQSKAAVWTDSRYYIQAEKQLNATYWELMKDDSPRQDEWLKSELGADVTVGQCARFFSIG
jgi:Xaa-Pro aminopeptidase